MKKHRSSSPTISHNPPSVSVEKAGNGFVISSYGDKGRKTAVAKNHDEVTKLMKKMLK